MHFQGKAGQLVVDFKGNLIISTNQHFISAFPKKFGPKHNYNANYIMLSQLSFFKRLVATWVVFRFIWSYKKPVQLKAKPAPLKGLPTVKK